MKKYLMSIFLLLGGIAIAILLRPLPVGILVGCVWWVAAYLAFKDREEAGKWYHWKDWTDEQ